VNDISHLFSLPLVLYNITIYILLYYLFWYIFIIQRLSFRRKKYSRVRARKKIFISSMRFSFSREEF